MGKGGVHPVCCFASMGLYSRPNSVCAYIIVCLYRVSVPSSLCVRVRARVRCLHIACECAEQRH